MSTTTTLPPIVLAQSVQDVMAMIAAIPAREVKSARKDIKSLNSGKF